MVPSGTSATLSNRGLACQAPPDDDEAFISLSVFPEKRRCCSWEDGKDRENTLPRRGTAGALPCRATRDEALERAVFYLRSDRKPARISSDRNFGCSKAAKCPPLGSLL